MKKIIAFTLSSLLVICAAAVFYYFQTTPQRELDKAKEALAIIIELRKESDAFLSLKNYRPNEMLDLPSPIKSNYDFIYDFNRNGPSAYRTPMFKKYRIHSVYPEHKNLTISDRVICDVYDLEYDYICQGLGATFYVKDPDAYCLKRYVFYQ